MTKLFLNLNVDYMGIFILKKIPQTQEEFQSSNTPNGTVMMDPCHHTLVHIHRTCITKSEPCCQTWDDSPSQCRFTNYRSEIKGPTLVGAVDDGEAVHVWGQGVEGKLCTRPQSCCEPKTAPPKFCLKNSTKQSSQDLCTSIYMSNFNNKFKGKEKKKKQKDSPTHQILKTTAYQENH